MNQLPISLTDLKALSAYALKHGTEEAFIAIALEWAEAAQTEIDRMRRTWIEPKPVIPPRPYMSSPDHSPEYVTGLSIPETPA